MDGGPLGRRGTRLNFEFELENGVLGLRNSPKKRMAVNLA
jgi:hypothetical protein